MTTPTAAVSHIMLEAYKKYLLVGLLVHGDKPKASKVINTDTLNQLFLYLQDNLALPKYTSPVVGKFLKPLCTAYNEVVNSYTSNNAAELRNTVTKYQVRDLVI